MPEVPIPRRMQHLERDPRGYPIPYNILRDTKGRPHFTINDSVANLRCLQRGWCPICGQSMVGSRWYLGGPRSAFAQGGVYYDLPAHYDCATYALKVCPYLAMPRYSRRLDGRTLTDEPVQILLDKTAIPDRPEVFVAVCARGHDVKLGRVGYHVVPNRPYQKVEFWHHGTRIPDPDGWKIVEQVMQTPLPALQGPRFFVR